MLSFHFLSKTFKRCAAWIKESRTAECNRRGKVEHGMREQGRIVREGAHLPRDQFTPLLKFSAPPPRIFAPPLINVCFSKH